ncbi:Na+/H+ antiporter NhaC family protein [Dethiothermospora halolimnae]|uniref:Na+/H+ antiporter NhaC family protein n=1 Tax=Dethiothermospora halolimnae TaxID=3114390 RepID=UPI003CCC3F91
MENTSKMYTYIILITSFGLIASCIIFNISLVYGFLGAIIFSIIMLRKLGFALKELTNMMIKGIIEYKIIFIIVVLMGTTISIWLSSGTVPALIYYGFKYIQDTNYLLACFFITSIISVVMGTGLGTLSTMGIALLAIGKGLSIPSHILLGTMISGAFLADKISPISGLVNLNLKVTGVKYNQGIKSMMKTLVPVFILSSIIYYFIGENYTSQINPLEISKYQQNIMYSFSISPMLLILPVGVIVMSIFGVKTVPNMSIGIMVGSLISIFYQNISVENLIKYVLMGFKIQDNPQLSEILKGGGVFPMTEVILIVMGALALNGLFDGTNIIAPIIDGIIKNIKSRGSLIARTGLLSMLLTTATCDQTVGIVVPGKFLKNKYKELNLDNGVLTRTISDTGVVIAPLEPWNVNSILIAVITGISTTEYAPYAVLCYLFPIITIATGYLNIRLSKVRSTKQI